MFRPGDIITHRFMEDREIFRIILDVDLSDPEFIKYHSINVDGADSHGSLFQYRHATDEEKIKFLSKINHRLKSFFLDEEI